MKKLLFFINTLGGGGAEKVLVDLVNSLDKDKYDIAVVSVIGGVHEARLAEHIKYSKLIKNEKSFLGRLLSRIIYRLPARFVYNKVVKDNYDIEIAYLEGFPTRVIAKGNSKAKKIAFVHCDVSVKPVLQKVYKNNNECLHEYSLFNKVCFVSKKALEGFEKTYGKLYNYTVVHNVINANEIQIKSLEENFEEYSGSGLKIISVGRLSPEKGYERLIRIVQELEKQYDFELWILGTGHEEKKLKDIIADNDIKSVKLLGYCNNPYSYMRKADLYVCPSYYEGYSTTVSECVILGIPVLTTDCAGMDEILENGRYGIIVENNDDALMRGVINCLTLDKAELNRYKRQNDDFLCLNNEYNVLFGE